MEMIKTIFVHRYSDFVYGNKWSNRRSNLIKAVSRFDRYDLIAMFPGFLHLKIEHNFADFRRRSILITE